MINTVATLSSLLPPVVVTAEYLRLLGDRDTSLLAHPALFYAGDALGMGAVNFQIPQLGLDGYRILSPVSEGGGVSDRALDDDSSTLTIAPWSKSYNFTDLAMAVASGKLTPALLAEDAVKATGNTLVHMIAQLVGTFTHASGTPGAALTGLHILSAKNALAGRSVPGPYVAVLSSSQKEDFELWLAATSGGGIQWMAATQAQIEAYGEGYQGDWGGVAIFMSNRVPTTNAGVDSAGGMFGRGGIAWGDCSFSPEPDPNIVDFGGVVGGRGRVRFERDRQGKAGSTSYVTHANLGAEIAQNDAGQAIITLAT
jgi:hypothetical protein